MSNQIPFDWWEIDASGMLVLPQVVGPEIPYRPVSDVERCDGAAYESMSRYAADEQAAMDAHNAAVTALIRGE